MRRLASGVHRECRMQCAGSSPPLLSTGASAGVYPRDLGGVTTPRHLRGDHTHTHTHTTYPIACCSSLRCRRRFPWAWGGEAKVNHRLLFFPSWVRCRSRGWKGWKGEGGGTILVWKGVYRPCFCVAVLSHRELEVPKGRVTPRSRIATKEKKSMRGQR